MLRWALVFSVVTLGWTLFKLPDFAQVRELAGAAWNNRHMRFSRGVPLLLLLYIAPVMIYHLLYQFRTAPPRRLAFLWSMRTGRHGAGPDADGDRAAGRQSHALHLFPVLTMQRSLLPIAVTAALSFAAYAAFVQFAPFTVPVVQNQVDTNMMRAQNFLAGHAPNRAGRLVPRLSAAAGACWSRRSPISAWWAAVP